MKTLFLIALLASMSIPAWAGCSNYEDGSMEGPAPRAKVCVSGACEETAVAFQCGNINGAQYGYANGFRVDFDKDGAVSASRGTSAVDFSKVTCTELDEGACFPVRKG